MLKAKRVLIASILGLIFGVVCILLASSGGELSKGILWSIVFSRGLLGFMIGISALRIVWWLHGIILGFIASVPMVLAIEDQNAIIWTLVMGVNYGFLIELITTVFLKAKPSD
jgi:hypothetical protein